MDLDRLIQEAWIARENAYVPYSHFPVGVALLLENGTIVRGCNVENLSYGLTICAERNAVATAVAAGGRRFLAVAIVSDSRDPISPCGACRQFLAEFGTDTVVVSENCAGFRFTSTLAELLPRAKTGILDQPNCST